MVKRFLEGNSPTARAKQRKTMGTLKQLTVQPSTRTRYDKAVNLFLQFLKDNNRELPRIREHLDLLVCDYLEHLWASGSGRALASDTLAGLQDFDVRLKGALKGAWRLMKTWSLNEIPNRAPPLPEHVVHAMCGWAIFHNHISFAVSLMTGFYGMLRTGEILGLRKSHFTLDPAGRKAVISLGLTKGGKRAGASESVVLGHDLAVKCLKWWMASAVPTTPLTSSPAHWRGLFNKAIASLSLTDFQFRPYSLRRGGATWWFSRHQSLDKILLQGRWQAPKTARIYINEGLSVLAEMQLPLSDPRIKPFLTQFRTRFHQKTFATLEPPVGRAGGRGKGCKPKNFKEKQCSECFISKDFPRKLTLTVMEVWLVTRVISRLVFFPWGLAGG